MNKRIAMLIDLDNFVGFCLELGLPIDVTPIIEKLSELGRVSFLYSFGDIYKFPLPNEKKQEIRKMLQENLVRHEDVRFRNQSKNSSDIRLVIEALTIAYTYNDVDSFAIIAQDRDYIALFSKLREIGRTTIGFGGNYDAVHKEYRSACDHFYSYELLFDTEDSKKQITENIQNGFELLVKAIKAVWKAVGENEHEVRAERVIVMIRHFRSDFEVRSYGLESFKEFFQKAKEENIINITPYPQIEGSVLSLVENKTPVYKRQYSIDSMVSQYKDWIREIIKIELPNVDTRELIYYHIQDIISSDIYTGDKMSDISNVILKRIGHGNIAQPQIYKILYSLYRAKAFYCTPNEDSPHNPIIISFSEGQEKNLDEKLIRNFLLQYKRANYNYEMNSFAWSICFFDHEDKQEFINDIIKYLP